MDTALVLFALAAIAGLYLASRIFADALPSWTAVALHGVFAATGLLIVLYALVTGTQSLPTLIGGGLLVIAALGGFYLLSHHVRKVMPPKAVVVVHALAAVAGFLMLLGDAFDVI